MPSQNNRTASLNFDDLGLDSIDESKVDLPAPAKTPEPAKIPVDPKVIANTEIFEELVQELDKSVISTEAEKGQLSDSSKHEIPIVSKRAVRRSSLTGAGETKDDDETAQIIRIDQPQLTRQTSAPDAVDLPKHTVKPCRRHSSYEPIQRTQVYKDHKKMKDYLQKMEDEQAMKRTNFVESMLEFNLSVDISMASMGNVTDSAAMHFSCPVLSYMGDDEEDSVEMMLTSTSRRPSLAVLEEEQSWKGLNFEPEKPKEDNLQVSKTGERTYTLELPEEPERAKKGRRMSRGKKNRKPSYKDLETRLENESPQEIIRSFSVNGSLASMKIDDEYVEKPMVSGRLTSFADDKYARFRSSSELQAAFRGSSVETSLNNHGF
eukprot:CAMPEP_0202447298 /NCGR_PEP_ID=MMETSP1360-20130828/6034_1 /ASSEMBLY_ACC=CAM_ASM_000848 /TAXON_ID=515479 /ORGANISM="Licmophora paradoxa, Strain CCMP2313" /LENGTH=376 /DNA_ID=CAMNT_0049064311 /DNA_START=64 /DNA_END=1194 /DNA_ORIENTATION=-